MENENTLAPQSDGIRSVSPGRGVEWLAGGFRIVFKTPGTWIVGGLILLVASFIANFIPLIGSALSTFVYVLALGAAMRACAAQEGGRDPVAEAQQAIGSQPMLVLAAIAGGLSLLIFLVGGALAATSVGTGLFVSKSIGIGMFGMNAILIMVLFIALFMALWLAPALVVFKNMDPIQAMKMSLKASMKNFVAYLVMAILAMIAFVLGAIPMGLGLLVVYPAVMCASYLAYQEMLA